jgi:protein phosphatase
MLICPHCKSENPLSHKFCQVCGVSLTHHTCTKCSAEVEFAAASCPECHTPSASYLLAIVTHLGSLDPNSPNFTTTAEEWDDVPITEISFADDDPSGKLDADPWKPEEQSEPRKSGDLTEDRALAVMEPPSVVATSAPEILTHLDLGRRYQLLEPTTIQFDPPQSSLRLRAIDCYPFQLSTLATLMAAEPVTVGSTSIDRQPESYRQWNFWNQHGIPRAAQAYIALKSFLSGTIPTIKDAWERDGQVFTIVEDRSQWQSLSSAWATPDLSPTQTIYWLDYTLKLWVALEPWQMRQSLLDIGNLVVDEDCTICLQSLQPEQPGSNLSLTDLGKLWRDLFSHASITPNPELIVTIGAIANGELVRIEDIRSALQQLAREWGGEITADISTTAELPDRETTPPPPSTPLLKELIAVDDGSATHVGKKREHNEDYFGIITKIDRRHSPSGRSVAARGLYILCDGMGGHDGGEVASKMTVDSLRQYFISHWKETIPDEQTIRDGIIAANQEVFDLNQSNSSSGNGRMGTTLVMLLLQDRTIAVAHVGDSRCYAITASQGLIQLTLDHEVGQQEILRGVDPEIAYGRANSYQLTQAIGPRDRNFVVPDVSFFELQEDTLILLASDGLTDNQLLETNWLTNVAPLMSSHADLQQGVDRLVDFANDYNGHDNITAIGVRVRLG